MLPHRHQEPIPNKMTMSLFNRLWKNITELSTNMIQRYRSSGDPVGVVQQVKDLSCKYGHSELAEQTYASRLSKALKPHLSIPSEATCNGQAWRCAPMPRDPNS